MSELGNRAEQQGSRYQEAGVDLAVYDRVVDGLGAMIGSTHTPAVIPNERGFGGLFRLDREAAQKPVLVASTDGVGTKLMIARMMNRHDTVGQDLVNHCANDILVQGARPLFFMDYFGTGHLNPEAFHQVVHGLAKACREHSCALLGGETAEMPGLYQTEDYDLVGTIVGLVEEDMILDGSRVRPGDRLIGLRSDGLHTNGYSLARNIIFQKLGLDVWSRVEELGNAPVGEILLQVHRPYGRVLLPILEKQMGIHALAHITGGGIPGNLCRVIPKSCTAKVYPGVWSIPTLFQWLQREGQVDEREMYDVFNMGVGMVMVVDPVQAEEVRIALRAAGEEVLEIGEIIEDQGARVVMDGFDG
jgi:phosphoribosylformylglycinamidine cyclo-ligase